MTQAKPRALRCFAAGCGLLVALPGITRTMLGNTASVQSKVTMIPSEAIHPICEKP